MDWQVLALAAAVGFLLLVVLGALREVMVLRGEVAGLSQLITDPPPPSFVHADNGSDTRAPDALIRALQEANPLPMPSRQIVAFVAPGCGPCEDIARDVSALLNNGGGYRSEELLFIVGAPRMSEAQDFAAHLPGRTILDRGAVLRRACEVRGTPTLFLVSAPDFHVTDYTVEGDAQWIATRLTHQM